MVEFGVLGENGVKITNNGAIEMEGKLFKYQVWGCAKPPVSNTFVADNLDLYFTEKIFNFTIYDCKGQSYSAVEGNN